MNPVFYLIVSLFVIPSCLFCYGFEPVSVNDFDGDDLKMLKTAFIDIDATGETNFWELSSDLLGTDYDVSYTVDLDTLLKIENNNVYRYLIKNDTLNLIDISNRVQYIEYDTPAYSVGLHVNHGDSLQMSFRGKAVYSENIYARIEGNSIINCKALGYLIIDGDTIGKARLLHVNQILNTISCHGIDGNTQSMVNGYGIITLKDEYTLFLDDYRYPVVKSISIKTGNLIEEYSLVYFPKSQVADLLYPNFNMPNKTKHIDINEKFMDTMVPSDNIGMVHKVLFNEDNTINIDFTLWESGDIQVLVSDVLGRVLTDTTYKKIAGHYNETIELNDQVKGNVLIVRIVVKDRVMQIKIVK